MLEIADMVKDGASKADVISSRLQSHFVEIRAIVANALLQVLLSSFCFSCCYGLWRDIIGVKMLAQA